MPFNGGNDTPEFADDPTLTSADSGLAARAQPGFAGSASIVRGSLASPAAAADGTILRTKGNKPMYADWIFEEADKIKNLTGETVTCFVATEIAFRGGEGDGPPLFADPALPFLQVCPLYIRLASGATAKFITYQNDDAWGIHLATELETWEPKLDAGSGESIFRTRKLTDFPIGLIRSVKVKVDPVGNISEVFLDISADPILLVAGEVYELADRKLDVVKGDESILLFRHPQTKIDVHFRNAES